MYINESALAQAIAEFAANGPGWEVYPEPWSQVPVPRQPREIAQMMLDSAVLVDVHLAGLLRSADGQLVLDIVERALPPWQRRYAQLVTDAILLIADEQLAGNQRDAKVLLVAGVAVLFLARLLGQ